MESEIDIVDKNKIKYMKKFEKDVDDKYKIKYIKDEKSWYIDLIDKKEEVERVHIIFNESICIVNYEDGFDVKADINKFKEYNIIFKIIDKMFKLLPQLYIFRKDSESLKNMIKFNKLFLMLEKIILDA